MKELIKSRTRTALDTQQVAYPVGENKDSYNIMTYFRYNTETKETTTTHEVVKNWMGENKKLLKGSYDECFELIQEIVREENLKNFNPLTNDLPL